MNRDEECGLTVSVQEKVEGVSEKAFFKMMEIEGEREDLRKGGQIPNTATLCTHSHTVVAHTNQQTVPPPLRLKCQQGKLEMSNSFRV